MTTQIDNTATLYTCWRVRPKDEVTWLLLEAAHMANIADFIGDVQPGDQFELEMFLATREEIENWGEFDGW